MRQVLISGGGSGIGAATAHKIAKLENHSVILLGRNEQKLQDTVASLPNSDVHQWAKVDVSQKNEVVDAFKNLNLENLSVVIANAGISCENHFENNDRWDEVIGINLTGSYNLACAAMPYLTQSKSDYRHVVFVSSVLAHMGVPSHSAYCASKAGQLGLMRALAIDWAEQKILVNAICPGWVETEMAKTSIQRLAGYTGKSYEDQYQDAMNATPLKKASTPNEIADLLCYLTGPGQTSITGEEIQINNGAYMV